MLVPGLVLSATDSSALFDAVFEFAAYIDQSYTPRWSNPISILRDTPPADLTRILGYNRALLEFTLMYQVELPPHPPRGAFFTPTHYVSQLDLLH